MAMTERKKEGPDSSAIKPLKEPTKQVRISESAFDLLKLNAVLSKKSMKDYLDALIYQDNTLKKEN